MDKKILYLVPDTQVISVQGEPVMQKLSSEHTSQVQDEYEDEEDDEDAPFTFAKKNNWIWEDE